MKRQPLILAALMLACAAGGVAAGPDPPDTPASSPASAADPIAVREPASAAVPPGVLAGIGIDQRLGERAPLDAVFRDETGREVALGDYFGRRPVILTLNYYRCPMLCPLVLNGLVSCLRVLSFDPGREFEIVTVSIDPSETAELASAAKAEYLRSYGRPAAERGWHFLTGSPESVDRLTRAAGFRAAWDPEAKQFAHAAGIIVATPDGRFARYFYGVEFAPRDLRLGLVEASEGKIGTLADVILLFCYHYDPATGRYGLAALTTMRIGGLLTIAALGVFVLLMLRRDRRVPRVA